MISVDFTVVIPTYNGERRLPQLLERLRSQTDIDYLNWEVIVVDNNSQDATAKVIQDYQAKWLKPYPLKYILEVEQGAAYARQRAIREAQGALIGFIDDDNIPEENWIAAAYSFAQDYPKAGAYGGQIHGDFEVEPPENFWRIQSFLAIREQGEESYRFEPENLRLPPSAALVIRKKAWIESVPRRPTLTGKLPGVMIQGEDYEPLLYIHKAGWEIWYNPAMHTTHQIPQWRLERDYLRSLARGCGLATCQLRMINAKPYQKPLIFTRTLLGNLRRVVHHFIKYRRAIRTDLVSNCELAFFLGSFVSPFYYLGNILRK